MGWRLGIVPPSMLWEMLAWAELEPTQMEKEPGRDDLWVFCPHGQSTVFTAEPKSKTHCHTLTVSHSPLRTHWLELSLTTQWQLLDVSYFANESSHSRNMCILQPSSETTGGHCSEDKSMHCFWVQTYIVPNEVYTFCTFLNIITAFDQSYGEIKKLFPGCFIILPSTVMNFCLTLTYLTHPQCNHTGSWSTHTV